MRHFIKETDFTPEEANALFARAKELKERRGAPVSSLERRSWGLLFYKSSTRTRVSFEVGIHELGGHPVVLSSQNTQIGRGESIEDTARVLSRYLHGLIIRTFGHEIIEEFSRHSTMPVINGLTDFLHPCQVYTDLFTLLERWSPPEGIDITALRGKKIAFFGDTASNMANSWILAAAHFGMEIALAGPESFRPDQAIEQQLDAGGLPRDFHFTTDANEAARGADVLYTDVWVSMGVEEEAMKRKQEMAPFTVTAALMERANPGAYFMHCLPAHPGEEVAREVLDSPAAVIYDQAENRLHAQKAILDKLVEVNR